MPYPPNLAGPLPGDLVPVRRPQFRLRDGALHFLVSRRPCAGLAAAERAVWEALDGEASVADLRARLPEAAEPALLRFLELGLCELVPARFPAGRRRVVVLEPHVDDAVLSLGGTLWRRREECEFTIVTIAGRSNFTSYYYLDREFFDVDEVSALRRAESALFARMLGGRHLALDGLEAPLRYRHGNWSLDWFRRHRWSVSAFIAHSSGPEELRAWTSAIRRVLEEAEADEVWMPLGVAPHTDHELARNACLAALLADPGLAERFVVRFYQEVPYAAQFPGYTAALVGALTRAGARLEREDVAVAEVFPEKLHLVSLFGSQFKLEVLRPGIEASAAAASGAPDGRAEVLFRLLAPPRELDPLSLHVDEEIVRRAARRLDPWLRRHRDAIRLRVFLRAPAGRWGEDVGLLLDALPTALVEAYVAPEGLAEAEELRSARVTVRPVEGGAAAWARLAARLLLRGPAPTLILPGRGGERRARILGALLPGSDTVIAPTMNHLALALRLVLAGDRRSDRRPA